MNPWIIPITCAVGAVVITFPAYYIVHDLVIYEKMKVDYYLSIRIENVPIDQISDHVDKINRELQFSADWVEPQVRAAHTEFPDGTIFFFNTSKEQWRRLGGNAGYAILLNGRIVWKRSIAIS